jgi:hypothetical protein
MTDSVPVASLVGPYPDDVLTLAVIIREAEVNQGMGYTSLAEAILSHPAWPALVQRFHPQEPAQPVPANDPAPDPIAEVLPASGEDWAAVVRKAAQPDGHEARVMLEIQQRLVTVEGPVVKAEPVREPVKQPAPPWGLWRPMDEAPTDGTRILAHDRRYYVNIAYWSRGGRSWQNPMGKLPRHWLCAWMPLPEAPKKS